MEHYPASQAYAGHSAWVIFVSKLGIAIMNHRTHVNNKGNLHGDERAKTLETQNRGLLLQLGNSRPFRLYVNSCDSGT